MAYYFEINNTPEHIRRERNNKKRLAKAVVPEEIPRLVLAPFTKPPQVVFEDVVLGTTSERNLEIFNPSKHIQQITLGKALPPGLVIELPEQWLFLEPETCYCITLLWTPTQPTALRETVRFTDDKRGRFDVIVVLKSAMNVKGKQQTKIKSFRISPGKIGKPVKKSPVALTKKKAEIIYETTSRVKQTHIVTKHTYYKTSDKENYPMNNHLDNSAMSRNPFDSSTNNFTVDISEVFSNGDKMKYLANMRNEKFDIPETPTNYQNVLKPSTEQNFNDSLDFDNIALTPLKSLQVDKLKTKPNIVISMNSDDDFDYSSQLNQHSKENEPHSILFVKTPTNIKSPKKEMIDHNPLSTMLNRKIPNTSSPKECNSPNFSIGTDFSRISEASFLPQRFSTDKKVMKHYNETYELFDDNPNSNTYTKDSPLSLQNVYPSLENYNQMYNQRFHDGRASQPNRCRQNLFKETPGMGNMGAFGRNQPFYETNAWQNELRADIRSPPRSITPPLQSIPEESAQNSDMHITNKSNAFTINRTFDKSERPSMSNKTQTWSKKDPRAEPELWKIPISTAKKSIKQATKRDSVCKISDLTFDRNKSSQNISLNQFGNVYSKSLTVDPFSSATYYYDEKAVEKFEHEFKRWLNYILTPPEDLDSNVEQKLDFGKAWIENRNKEIPAAPTKEQVCSSYHNSHRLQKLRKSAKLLLKNAEIQAVIVKLNAQIDKKLIAIRNDRNLHLDVGLQKAILEIILSYNPLWLRLGLEAIYNRILPLRSNSDIEGLTTFIVQHLFRNPDLKSKNSKPNMLSPAYMEAIKRFSLKKFFLLVFFLDQAKQRKLIPHDPCLFCRNAVCKESKEIIIRFTRELIAGIGDITKHLRPVGYVVVHKQSYLDEYKYAVHNIAVDIRDGVRITKVMEIILMKNNLMSQLRTPAISRLQKVHNVQVTLNALKETNFTIAGDITASDIADGHREKTLSFLWQIIHVFRAPLFQTAANVIQIWWKEKYKVIKAKRLVRANAAAVTIQKYCRMWLCRNRLKKMKTSVAKIEDWYLSVKSLLEAKKILYKLRIEKERLQRDAAIKIQAWVKRWICVLKYQMILKKIVIIQSIVRRFLERKRYLEVKEAVTNMQRRYRGKLLMRKEMGDFKQKRDSATLIQSYYKMYVQRKAFMQQKQAVKVIEERYIAQKEMTNQKQKFLHFKQCCIKIQALYRGLKQRTEYQKTKKLIINLQRKVRATQLMKKEKSTFVTTKNAVIVIQTRMRAYLLMKEQKREYLKQRQAIITIQKYYRCYLLTKSQRKSYLELKTAATNIQRRYRALLAMRKERSSYLKLKKAAHVLQCRYRAQVAMKNERENYDRLYKATLVFQRRYRAQLKMRETRSQYLKLKSVCLKIQRTYRAYVLGKKQRIAYLIKKNAIIDIQRWYRSCKKKDIAQNEYVKHKNACVTIQRTFRAYLVGKAQRQEYLKIRTATICIQKYFKLYLEMTRIKQEYLQLKTVTIKIQRLFRAKLEGNKQRSVYLAQRNAIVTIQEFYRRYRLTKTIQNNYLQLKQATVTVQRSYRRLCLMRKERNEYIELRNNCIIIQNRFRAILAMKKQRVAYQKLRAATVVIQTRYRALRTMKEERQNYIRIKSACITIQRYYKARILGKMQRDEYLKCRTCIVNVQRRFRALLAMKQCRQRYINYRQAIISLQRRYRARLSMKEERSKYLSVLNACKVIQNRFRAYKQGKKQRESYLIVKSAVSTIQYRYRLYKQTESLRNRYLSIRTSALLIQRRFRANQRAREIRKCIAAKKISEWYRAVKIRNRCRTEYLKMRNSAVIIQSVYRMYVDKKKYQAIQNATLSIQRYYRSYKLACHERSQYIKFRSTIILMQSYVRQYIQRKRFMKLRSAVLVIQRSYKMYREIKLEKERRVTAAICIQKHFRRYLAESEYRKIKNAVLVIQRKWRSTLVTRLFRCNFLQKRNVIVKLQACVRGYLARKRLQLKKEEIKRTNEERKQHWAASKIQALFRGHRARIQLANDARVADLRRRWREGALQSTQETLSERNEEAMFVLNTMCSIPIVIRAFTSLELLTEVFPMLYNDNATVVADRVFMYMSVTNRSISSVEVLKSAASVLVNLARYKVTGPKIYNREHIPATLKFMWRFSNSETLLFRILCTFLWVFSKYDHVRKDLTTYLHLPENHKMMNTIKSNVDRMRRMTENSAKKKPFKVPCNKMSQTINASIREMMNSSLVLPAMEPDYGIKRDDRPRYFDDAGQAIDCLFKTYNL